MKSAKNNLASRERIDARSKSNNRNTEKTSAEQITLIQQKISETANPDNKTGLKVQLGKKELGSPVALKSPLPDSKKTKK